MRPWQKDAIAFHCCLWRLARKIGVLSDAKEELDRAFRPEKQGECTLPHLLNALDGVGNAEGVIASANHPEDLDAAILKRPGRFDRGRVLRGAQPTAAAAVLSAAVPGTHHGAIGAIGRDQRADELRAG